MASRPRVHKVGLTVAAIGLPCMLVLPFAIVRANRVDTGDGVGFLTAVGPALAAVLIALWIAVIVLAVLPGFRRPWAALARGLVASAIVVAVVSVSGAAATRLAVGAGAIARVSVGGGAWAAMAAAWLLVIASRREAAPLGRATTLLSAVAPIGVAALALSGSLADMGMAREYANVADRYWVEAASHAAVSVGSVAVALIIGLWLGVAAYSSSKLEGPVLTGVSLVQTIPGLAMIGILVAPLSALAASSPWLQTIGVGGIGWAPVAVALVLYALLVIVHDTVAGLESVSREAGEASRAMGMAPAQTLWRVKLPIASPVVYTGVRTASLQTVGNATLGAFVGGWTLGRFVFQGMAEGANDLVLIGSIGVVAVALLLDVVLKVAEPALVPLVRRRGRTQVG